MLRTLTRELYGSLRHRSALPRDCNELEASVLANGIYVWPDFWSSERCADARQAMDELFESHPECLSRDALHSDERWFGIDRIDHRLDLFGSADLRVLIERLFASPHPIVGTTLAGRLTFKEGNLGSGGGWHRDSAIAEQFKALLYLSDVDEENGPFEYALGTGRRRSIWLDYADRSSTPGQHRYPGGLPLKHEKNRFRAVGRAGTLLIVNTRGIHRGAPIMTGRRYALTNYYFRNRIPPHIASLIKVPAAQ